LCVIREGRKLQRTQERGEKEGGGGAKVRHAGRAQVDRGEEQGAFSAGIVSHARGVLFSIFGVFIL
jgi:hypothetical protein